MINTLTASLAALLLLNAATGCASVESVQTTTTVPFEGTTEFRASDVRAVHRDEQGRLWFGTAENGVFSFSSGEWTHWSEEDGLAGASILSFANAPDGSLFAAGGGGVSKFDNSMWQRIETPVEYRVVFKVHADKGLWLGGNPAAARLSKGGWTVRNFGADGLPGGVAHFTAPSPYSDSAFVGTRRSGLIEIAGDEVTVRWSEMNFRTVLIDKPAQSVWFGTSDNGILRLSADGEEWVGSGLSAPLFFTDDGRLVASFEDQLKILENGTWRALDLALMTGSEIFSGTPYGEGAALIATSKGVFSVSLR